MNLNGANIVVYDCEIENEIDGQNVTWYTYDKMGFSVAALYDYRTGDYSIYLKDDVPALAERLNTADLVVAFNHIGFDNKLVAAHGGVLRDNLAHYDMLVESRKSIGWTPDQRFPSGMKLDDHLQATFGAAFMKTGHGEMAPKWWQQGLKSKVISYCLADVNRERRLFEHIVNKGWAATVTHGKRFFDLTLIERALNGVGNT